MSKNRKVVNKSEPADAPRQAMCETVLALAQVLGLIAAQRVFHAEREKGSDDWYHRIEHAVDAELGLGQETDENDIPEQSSGLRGHTQQYRVKRSGSGALAGVGARRHVGQQRRLTVVGSHDAGGDKGVADRARRPFVVTIRQPITWARTRRSLLIGCRRQVCGDAVPIVACRHRTRGRGRRDC